MNILIILAEICLTIFVFFLLNWLWEKFSKLLVKLSIFKSEQRNIKTLSRNVRRLLIISCLALSSLIIGVNGYLIYRGENLQQYTLLLIRSIPSGFWISLGIGITQSIVTVILAAIARKLVRYWLKIACIRAKNIEQNTADDQSIESFFDNLNKVITSGIWLWVLICCSNFLKVPVVITEYLYILLRIYLIIAVGLLIPKAVTAIIDSLDALSLRYSSPDNLLRFHDRLRHLIPFLKRCWEFIIYVCVATLVIQQVKFIANIAIFGPRIVKIIGIIFISRVLFEVIYIIIEEILFQNKNLTEVQTSRRLTLVPLIRSFLQYLVYFTAIVSILYILDINPTPILAGAGILGIAVGFGAQALINDIVCGFFILFENYYLVGDYIQAGKSEDKLLEGTVEAIELRTTRIRHPNGQLQIIRNGEIGSITNYSKQYIFAVVEITIPYDANLAHVYELIDELGKQLKVNEPDVLEPTQVDGIESLGESNLLLRTLTKVKPGKHLQIQRVLRKIFIHALASAEITTPVPVENTEP
ncbi:MAG: mechanosensitive ion channel family protein [Gloeotrichia echinulata GP01]